MNKSTVSDKARPMGRIEHVNITVVDAEASAQLMCRVFGWRIRWRGDAAGPTDSGGCSIHVGTDDDYLAVYAPPAAESIPAAPVMRIGSLNHVGVVVDDLDAIEARVLAEGIVTHSHGSYEPGRRFYFHDANGVEYEVVSYPDAG